MKAGSLAKIVQRLRFYGRRIRPRMLTPRMTMPLSVLRF